MAWTNLSFPTGSKLSATQMTQLQANFQALANGDNGAPNGSRLAAVWINFNMVTTTINRSYNVAGLTDGGVGDHFIHFTTALASANYAAAGICYIASGLPVSITPYVLATTYFRIATHKGNGVLEDSTNVHVVIFE